MAGCMEAVDAVVVAETAVAGVGVLGCKSHRTLLVSLYNYIDYSVF